MRFRPFGLAPGSWHLTCLLLSLKRQWGTGVYDYVTEVASEREAQRISTAFYRFLERHGDDMIDRASMAIEPTPVGQRICIKVWSPEAILAFKRYVASFSVPPPEGIMVRPY